MYFFLLFILWPFITYLASLLTRRLQTRVVFRYRHGHTTRVIVQFHSVVLGKPREMAETNSRTDPHVSTEDSTSATVVKEEPVASTSTQILADGQYNGNSDSNWLFVFIILIDFHSAWTMGFFVFCPPVVVGPRECGWGGGQQVDLKEKARSKFRLCEN